MNYLLSSILSFALFTPLTGSSACCDCCPPGACPCPPECCASGCCDTGCCDQCCPTGCCEAKPAAKVEPKAKTECCTTGCCR